MDTERAAAERELFEKAYSAIPRITTTKETAWLCWKASRAQEAPALLQSDVDAMRKMQEGYDSLAERWREARPYSHEVANLHATFKAFDSRLGKLIEGGLFKRLLAALSASPALPAAAEQQEKKE